MPWTYKGNLKGPAGDTVSAVQIAGTVDLNTLIDVQTYILYQIPADATSQHYPVSKRASMVVKIVSSYVQQTFTSLDTPSSVWIRLRNPNDLVWSAWAQPGVGTSTAKDAEQDARLASLESSVTGAQPSSPVSGFKLVPLQLTLGQATPTFAPKTQNFRIAFKYAAPLRRVRFHIRNMQTRLGTVETGVVDFTGMWFGQHAGAGAFTDVPKQVQAAFTMNTTGAEYVTKWFDANTASGTDYLVSLGYTAVGNVVSSIGSGWTSPTPGNASVTAPALTVATQAPFQIWMEAETYATTPTIAVIGDSLSCGETGKGIGTSMLSQHCLTVGALPIHWANSGDTMGSFADLNAPKWNFYTGLAKADAVIFAIGSNDIFSDGVTLATYQSRVATVAAQARIKISPNLYLANITPRTARQDSGPLAVRRAVNTWLAGLPNGARDIFDFVTAISDDDLTIKAAFDFDGTHMNTAGYTEQAASVSRPVTTKQVMYVS